jgi:sugar lactone lactonase YvrE
MPVIRVLALATLATLGLSSAPAVAQPFSDVIDLPVGFQPEGIDVGRGSTAYVGSLTAGAVFRIDLRTGAGDEVVPPRAGRVAVGLKFDAGRLFVAGGPTGQAYVYGAASGQALAVYQLTTDPGTFVNDVVVTKDAAWFTDSFRPVLYRVPIAPDGTLGSHADVEEVPLGGDYVQGPDFNVNGIDATPNGKTLVIVQSNTGTLYRVDPATGVADAVELTGGDASFGDGILLEGRTLYVVQNSLDQVAVVSLAPDLGSGVVTGHLTDSDFDVPTTIARFGSALYVVNARFNVADPTTAEYWVAKVPA